MLNAGGFIAAQAIKMGMVVVVVAMITSCTNCIFGLELLVWNSMENPRIQELFETPVNGGAVNAAGEASTAVVVGTTNAVNGLIDGASGAGVSVIKGARRAASGVTAAAKKLLERTGKAANGALGMKGGRRNRTNRNRKNKNRTNRNRRNRN